MTDWREWNLFDFPGLPSIGEAAPGLAALAMLVAIFAITVTAIIVCTTPYHP